MPYSSISQLPSEVKNLPEYGQRIFLRAFNTAFKKYRDEEKSFKIAWSAVKQVYEKTQNGWEKKKSFDRSLVFSKSFESFKADMNENDFYVEGYIETPGVDILGDMCSEECLNDIDNQLSNAIVSAKIGRDHEHSLIDNNLLHAAKIISHKKDENGVWIKAKLNKFHPDFTTIKGSIEDGFYDAFSIEYYPEVWTEDFITKDGEYVPRKLDKVLLTGVTFTGKPVNHEAVITNFGEGLIKSMAIKEAQEEMKAVWSKAYIDTLPDSSFAYIEKGGKKDKEGKTVPRSLRHLPYKDKNGKVDLPHLRNALARLDQTDIPAEAKKKAKEKLLAAAKKAGIKVQEKSPKKEESKMTEEKKAVADEVVNKEEVKSEQPQETKTSTDEQKVEVKETKEEVKSETTNLEEEVKALKEENKALKEKLAEEIKSAVIEELKSLQPEQKNLVDTKEKKFAKEEIKSDVISQTLKQLGLKESE